MASVKRPAYEKKAVVLLSGGLDSATSLYIAKHSGYKPFCLVFEYGQRHAREIGAAERIARKAQCSLQRVKISLPWKGSSLLDKSRKIPEVSKGIPSTYVPGRNIIFLSFALSFAEAIGAKAIFIGANAIDYSGYPDCRPLFYRAFDQVAKVGTKAGVEGKAIKIMAPLINKTKAQIVKIGQRLGVPYALTWSCYKGGRYPCGRCDSCRFRAKGFREAGLLDPLRDTQ